MNDLTTEILRDVLTTTSVLYPQLDLGIEELIGEREAELENELKKAEEK